jgi:radical SAM superfamily enzyme
MYNEYWEHNRRFNAYPDYLRKKLGGRVQKLTIDGFVRTEMAQF